MTNFKKFRLPLLASIAAISAAAGLGAMPAVAQEATQNVPYTFSFHPTGDASVDARNLSREATSYCSRVAHRYAGIRRGACRSEIINLVSKQIEARDAATRLANNR